MVLLKPIPAAGSGTPPQPSGDVESGWRPHPGSWRGGDATEAASRVLRHAFDAGLDHAAAISRAGR